MYTNFQGKRCLTMCLKHKFDTLSDREKEQFIHEIHSVVDQSLRNDTSSFLQALPIQAIQQLELKVSSLRSDVNTNKNLLIQLSSYDVFQQIGAYLTFGDIICLSQVNSHLYINTHVSTFVLQRRSSNDSSFVVNRSMLQKIELYDKDSSLMYHTPESITLDLAEAFNKPIFDNRHMDDFVIKQRNQGWWRNIFSSVNEIIFNQGNDYMLPYIPCDLVFKNNHQNVRLWYIEFQHMYHNWDCFDHFHQNFSNHAKDRHIETLGIVGVQNQSAQKACQKLIQTFTGKFDKLNMISCKCQIDTMSYLHQLFHSQLKEVYVTYDSKIEFIENKKHLKSTCDNNNDEFNIHTLSLTHCNRRNNHIMTNLTNLKRYQILKNVENLRIDWDIKAALHRYSHIKQKFKSTLMCENPQYGWLYHLLNGSNDQLNISSLTNISIKVTINQDEDLHQLIRELRCLDDISIDAQKSSLQKIHIQIQFQNYDGYTLLLPSHFTGHSIDTFIYTRKNQFNIPPKIFSNIEMWLLYCGDYFCKHKNGFTNIIVNVTKEMQMTHTEEY